jgi:hypothetical protein
MPSCNPSQLKPELMEPSRVFVLYENAAAREHALRATRDLPVAHWWSFARLAGSPRAAQDASLKAATADMVVFAVTPAGDLPGEIKLWIETWISRRSEREGVIVGLVARRESPGEIACLKEIYLRHTAHRAGMDYLSRVQPATAMTLPDSLDSCKERERHISSVLDDILHSSFSPPTVRL